MIRPTWHEYFMDMAKVVATRSTCQRLSVGCILTIDNRILTTGYNGSPSGLVHCIDKGCLLENDRCVRTIHAEQNAIVQAARLGISLIGCTAYITHYPCLICAKLLINCNVRMIIYNQSYLNILAENMLSDAEIEVIQL